MSSSRFAVYITGDPSDMTRERFGDYGDLFRELLREEGDTWDFYDARLLEYPDTEQLATYDGIVITGSPATAHEPEPWIVRLNAEIRRAFDANVRIIGVCFGHQAVANALGGRSDRNPQGWEAGLFELIYDEAEFPADLAKFIAELPRRILEIHSDHVVDPPTGARVFASTEKTKIQAYCIPGRVLGLQGHPEFNNDIVRDLVRSRARSGIIDDKEAIEMLNSMRAEPDRIAWRELMNCFLRTKA